jgi:Na+-translocating ferredoxin:NAD+ oxidoreductase RnfC subunit
VYEVEAVIGKRGRGARLQYRVKWAGWPLEQASWLPVSECDSCAEAVADFERQQLQRQQRVAAVHQQQQRKAEARLQQWKQKTGLTLAREDSASEEKAQSAAQRRVSPPSARREFSDSPALAGEISQTGPRCHGAELSVTQAKTGRWGCGSSSLHAQTHTQDTTRARVSSPTGSQPHSPTRAA